MGLDEQEYQYAVVEEPGLTTTDPVVIAEWRSGRLVIGCAPGETTPQFRAALAAALKRWRPGRKVDRDADEEPQA
ncbi:hypothetical protein B4N89_20845 [Embleya scabrispora]|uniref:Uncharacterized protein n=1 Tax=Embleya scabrispora TaxID=159449 RepID=A0A1T3P287_9ACTN|nr:hypothetical protein B4N89_20845 [Embleya scabrispora]